MIHRPRPVMLIAALTLTLSLSACSASASIGTKQVDKAEVVKQVSAQLAKQVGKAPDSVTCPDNLDAKVGADLDCSLTDQGANYGVHVTVSSVDGDNVNFDIKVADHPS
jgi:predicted secreted protein